MNCALPSASHLCFASLKTKDKTEQKKKCFKGNAPLQIVSRTSAPTAVHDTYFEFCPSPGAVTRGPLISIIINICLFNFQLCHNVST